MTPKLLTPEEVAERLQVKPRTAYHYLAEGGPLHHLRIEVGPRTVRVDPAALEQFIASGGHHAGNP